MNTFWLVWSPDGHNPQHRHATDTLAKQEAERLARSNPGKEFFVLEALGSVVKSDLVWTMAQDLPF